MRSTKKKTKNAERLNRISGKHGGWRKSINIQKDGKSKVLFQKVEKLILKWRKVVTSSKIKITQNIVKQKKEKVHVPAKDKGKRWVSFISTCYQK